ncbi:DUF6431 domain-containing protein [Salipaludibacillus sp. CUR1]|uniref:DUF6431 domain-containing protein n=1 Tax=Salipaludibacillus sp. CUR1 TaxID=2820003 RepID=UPI00351D0A20
MCREKLNVIGSRNRIWKQMNGNRSNLRIRRLKCDDCLTIHHELPDILIPHKHYDAASIEAVVHPQNKIKDRLPVGAESSTLSRWIRWFSLWLANAIRCLQAIMLRYFMQVPNPSSPRDSSVLQLIGEFVGIEDGWLTRLVRPIVNTHSWLQTRFAYLSSLKRS